MKGPVAITQSMLNTLSKTQNINDKRLLPFSHYNTTVVPVTSLYPYGLLPVCWPGGGGRVCITSELSKNC
jgi:hypothetical protein